MENEIRIVFIGAGNHAVWTLYPTLQYFPHVNLVAVCDLDGAKAESVAHKYGAPRSYTDYSRMLDTENPDAVFCCGGPSLHVAVIRQCIERKLPLFVEKPPAPSAAELKNLADDARNSSVPVMVAFMHRFAPVTTWAMRVMQNERFGKTMMAFAREGLWAMDGNNMVMDSGIHHLDLLRGLFGDVGWVQATKVSDGYKRHAVAVTMMFCNGVLGQVNLNSLESLTTPSDVIEIHGDQGGYVRLDNWTKATWVRDPGSLFHPPQDPMNSSLTYEHGWTAAGANRSTLVQGYVDEIGHFLSCLADDRKPVPNLDDGYRALQLVEAINHSTNTGQRVSIDME